MLQLFSESLKAPTLPATILLLIVLVYWLVNLLGIVDFDGGDADVDGSSENDTNLSGKILDFGDMPFTITISFFALFLWMGTVLSNHYLSNSSMLLGIAVLVPNLLLSFVLTKMVAKPIGKLFKFLNNKSEIEGTSDFSGSVCTVNIGADDVHIGQAEINKDGDCFRINIKTSESKVLKKGQTALLVEYFPSKGYYLAEPYESN